MKISYILLLFSIFSSFACSRYDVMDQTPHGASMDKYTVLKYYDLEGACYSFDVKDRLEILNKSQISESEAAGLARAKINTFETGKCLVSFTCISGERPVWQWEKDTLKIVGVELIKNGRKNFGLIGESNLNTKNKPRMPLYCR